MRIGILRGISRAVRLAFPQVRWIDAQGLRARLAEAGSHPVQLLDVREEPEFRVSHLPGARRVAPGGDPAWDPASSAALDPARPVILYCSVGLRSARLAESLMRAGFGDVLNLEGGIFGWVQAFETPELEGLEPERVHPYGLPFGLLLPARRRSPISDS